MKYLFYFIIIFYCLNSYSNPAPLGLELNKTSLLELSKKYKITRKELNYWQGYNYFIELSDIKTRNISKALVICNNINIIEAVILTTDKNKFDEFYKILSNKYSLEQKNEQTITFSNDNCLIIMDSSEYSAEMELVYITKSFYTDFLNKLEKEEEIEQKLIKDLL